jgi:hypothetical protein
MAEETNLLGSLVDILKKYPFFISAALVFLLTNNITLALVLALLQLIVGI